MKTGAKGEPRARGQPKNIFEIARKYDKIKEGEKKKMKKIVIQPISIAEIKGRTKYTVSAERFKGFSEPVYYSMTGILPQFLAKGDDVKLITVVSSSEKQAVQDRINENTKICHTEFKDVCEKAGVSFSAEDINIPYDVNNTYFEKMFSDIIEKIEEGSELFVDNTLGDRIISMFLYSVVQFAEQCLGCKLNLMTWAKRDYKEDGTPDFSSYRLTDITSVYYLNKIIGTLRSSDSKKAIKTVQDFLSL